MYCDGFVTKKIKSYKLALSFMRTVLKIHMNFKFQTRSEVFKFFIPALFPDNCIADMLFY